MIDIVKNAYPDTKVTKAEMIGDILMVGMNGDIRLYKFEGDKLFSYTPTQITGIHVGKIKSIIREGKINQLIEK